MTRGLYLALALGFAISLALTQGVSAAGTEKKISENYTADLLIPAGEYKAFIIHLAPGDRMTLTVRVGLGEEIDVYTMSKSTYEEYKAGAQLIIPYSQFSKESLKYFEYAKWFEPATEGDQVIVVDNTPYPSSGSPGSTDVSCTVNIKVEYKTPFPWALVGGAIGAVIAVAVVVLAMVMMKKKRQEHDVKEAQKKRAEAAKLRPIFINPQAAPGAPGAPGMPAAPSAQAPPPSSSCKSCPHIYDPTSANCIACEYR